MGKKGTKSVTKNKPPTQGNNRRNPRYSSHQAKSKYKIDNTPIIQSNTIQLINSLDQKKLFNNNNFELQFLSEINYRQFNTLFSKGIDYARTKFSQKNLKILKKILLLLKDVSNGDTNDEFGLEKCANKLLRNYRYDLLLTLLSDEQKIIELEINDINDTEDRFRKTIDYRLYINRLDAFDKNPSFNKDEDFKDSYKKFKDIVFSPTVLEIYREVLKELYGVNVPSNELKKVISDFLDKHDIYFISMDKKLFGFIIYNGTIFLNKANVQVGISTEDTFVTYFTLLHEIMHALSRLYRGNKNYLIDTGEFLKNNIKKVDESGEYFDQKFVLGLIKGIRLTSIEAKFFLDMKNYNFKSVLDFNNAFLNWRKKNINIIKNSPTFKIGKSSSDDSFSILIGCRFGAKVNFIE